MLAVTGTNGKTTPTALTGQLVERAGKRVAVAGNIGPTLLDTLAAALDCIDDGGARAVPEVWVLELSSFQLDGVRGFEPDRRDRAQPDAGPPRLARHMDAYAAAKARVFGERARDGAQPRRRARRGDAAGAGGGSRAAQGAQPQRDVLRFGVDVPQRPGDFGIDVENGMAWLVRALRTSRRDRCKRGAGAEAEELHLQRLMPADALRIRGRHNAVNALAALALASATGCPLAPMLYGLREYRGEPHRVESVAHRRRRRVLRRQQGHQRRRHGRRAATAWAPTRRRASWS